MNQPSDRDDDLRPEYDFSQMPLVARGRPAPTVTVQLDPDLAALFPDADAVNQALRLIVRMAPRNPPTV
jgi:histidinol-phosphate/aromatic aminotransferase/cobyric acid decarboxylase-like protein